MKFIFLTLSITLLLINCSVDYKRPFFEKTSLDEIKLYIDKDDALTFSNGGLFENYMYGRVSRNDDFYNVRLKIRGSTSRFYYKKNYRIDRYDNDNNSVIETYFLDSVYDDKSKMRNLIAMNFFNRVGIPAPEIIKSALFINNQYYGFYYILEPVNEAFLEKRNMKVDLLIKASFDKCTFRLTYNNVPMIPVTDGFDAEIPKNDSMLELGEIIVKLNTSPRENYKEIIEKYFDIPNLINYLSVLTIFNINDVHAKNYYLYKSDSKYSFLPWDCEENMKNRSKINIDSYFDGGAVARNLLYQFVLSEDGYREKVKERIADILSDNHREYLLNLVDETFQSIKTAVKYDRNRQESYSEFEENVKFIRNYIENTFPN